MAKFEINIDVNGEAKIASLQNNIDKLDKSNKQAKSSSGELSSSLKSIGIAAGSYFAVDKLASALVGLGASTIQTASEFEKFGLILETLYGSSEKAQQSLGWIKEFSQKTPYTLKETTDAFVKLKSYGIEGTNGTLKTLGDTAAAMGKPLIQGVEAMADALTGENERLKEFGIKGSIQGQKIGYAWTDASGKSKHIIVENNKEVIRSTLEAIFNSKYEGAMEKLSGSFGGLVSNMTDSFDSLKLKLADSGAFDGLKEAIRLTTVEINSLADSQDAMNGFGVAFTTVISGIVKTLGFFGKATIQVIEWSEFLSTAYTVSINWIQTKINNLVIAFVETFKTISEFAQKMGIDQTKQLADQNNTLKMLREANKSFADDSNKKLVSYNKEFKALEEAQGAIDKITKSFEKAGEARKKALGEPIIKKDVVGALPGDLTSGAGKVKLTEQLTEQQKLEKKAIDEKIRLENEAVLAGLDGYARQFKALEQWKTAELKEYASVAEMEAVIDKTYLAKKSEIERKQSDEQTQDEEKRQAKIFEAKKKNAELIAGLFSSDLTETQSLDAKYTNLIQQMAETGQATNEQYEAINKKYLTDLEKIEQDKLNKTIEEIRAWGGIAQEFLTTAFNNVYDEIKDSYAPLIESNQYLARSLDLQGHCTRVFNNSVQ